MEPPDDADQTSNPNPSASSTGPAAPPSDTAASIDPELLRVTRRLSRAAELIHGVSYYADEINRFRDDGFRGWWHTYLAYRSAPMGPVGAATVVAAFYNFAPRMVERAVPGVWDIMTPDAVLARREELVAEALRRIYTEGSFTPLMAEAADLAEHAVADLDPAGRPLSAAVAALDRPGDPAPRLWHACTLWREYRGDGHNIALAAAGVDGVECHLLMAAAGHGNQPTLAAIRGWDHEEWSSARQRLAARGFLDDDGAFTEQGQAFRDQLELTTDRLAAAPVQRLGPADSARLLELTSTIGNHLKEIGEVPGVWPPPTVRKG